MPDPITDLRSALAALADIGEGVAECSDPVDPDCGILRDYVSRYLTPTASVFASDQPLVLYRNPVGFRFPVLMGVFGSRRRNRFYVDPAGRHPAATPYARLFADALDRPLAPAPATDAPCQRNLAEGADPARLLPALRLLESDPAPSITLGLVYARDEEGGIANCSFHRMCLRGDGSLTVWIAPNRHLGQLRERAVAAGRRLPVSVNIGLDPAVYLAACATKPNVRYGMDELGLAGGLRGHPVGIARCASNEAWCIAHAEIVIEGTLGPETALETLDGAPGWSIPEYLGYRRNAGAAALMKVSAVAWRDGALYQALTGPGREQSEMLGSAQELSALTVLDGHGVRVVSDVHCSAAGGGCLTVVLSVDKTGADDDDAAVEAARIVAREVPFVKHVFLVDRDVNAQSEADLLWAMTTRFRPDVDLTVLAPSPGSHFDPTQSGSYRDGIVDGTVAKSIFDCTVPFAQRHRFERAFFPPGKAMR